MMRAITAVIVMVWMTVSGQCQITLPDDFVAQNISMDLETPVGIVFTNSGQGFIWEKDGRVWTMEDDVIYPTPIIDIAEEVNNQADHGLVGFALDPAFTSTGFVYLYYVVDRHHLLNFGTPAYDPNFTTTSQATIGRVTRYTLDKAAGYRTAVPGSRKVILGDRIDNGLPILMTSHGVGSLVFGTDGSLLLTFGDGGSFTESDIGNSADTYHEQSMQDGALIPDQNVGSLRAMMKSSPHGKVLRINPADGSGLPSNPFYIEEEPNSWQSKVWAMGFRNPYKFMKLPNTGSHVLSEGNPGTFWVGDVGSSYWEEINVVKEGGKWYGWPYYEGHNGKWEFQDKTAPNPEAVNPLAGGGCSELIDFRSLQSNTKQTGEYELPNPCDSNIPIPREQVLIHEAPLLAYSSSMWNPPAKTTVAGWTDNGNLRGVSVTDSESGIDGVLIEGGSILPGGQNLYDSYPEEYVNMLFVGDFDGTIAAINLTDQGKVESLQEFAEDELGMTDLTFNPKNGSLYYVHLFRKAIVKIEYGGSLPPTIITEQSKSYGPSPLTVEFDASASYSNVDGELTYEWRMPDGSTSSGETLTAQFAGSGPTEHIVQLTAVDTAGNSSIEKYTVSVNNTPPGVQISSLTDGSTYSIQAINTVALRASVTDDEHSQEELHYSWRVNLYHDDHYHQGPEDNRVETYAFLDPVGCGLESYSYKAILSVTDGAGLTGNDTVSLYPYCGEEFAVVLDLSASESEGIVQLTWSAELEQDVEYYELERSDDFLYKTIGRADADGGPYLLTDGAPYLGLNKYRLKAYNINGDFLYSNTAEILIENTSDLTIYPNPSTGLYNVISNNPEQTEGRVYAYDLSGRLIYDTAVGKDMSVIQHTIDASGWSSGLYYIGVATAGRNIQQRVLKL